jgi:hypothetical protein
MMNSNIKISDHQVISAGVLFYSFPPNSEDVYFLLGMDSFGGKWSEFGGGKKENETEVECASREMIEETLGVVKWNDLQEEVVNKDNIETQTNLITNNLKNKEFLFKISVCINPKYKSEITNTDTNSNTDSNTDVNSNVISNVTSNALFPPTISKKLRVCYVKSIPWQPCAPDIFHTVYKSLKHLQNLASKDSKIQYYKDLPDYLKNHPAIQINYENGNISDISIQSEWMEKQKIEWWSLSRLKNVLRNGGKFKYHSFRLGFLTTLGIVVEKFFGNQQVKSNLNILSFKNTSNQPNFSYIPPTT